MIVFCGVVINASQGYDTQESSSKRLKSEPSQIAAAKFMLYHKLNPNSDVESVKEQGLYSFSEAYKLGLVGCVEIPSMKLDRRKKEEDIYFLPVDDGQCEIAYEIPLNNLFVQNGAYRKYRQWVEYNQSKVSLEHYLQAIQTMQTLQQQYPDKTFKLHPISCKVLEIISKNVKPRATSSKVQSAKVTAYNPEVVVSAGHIPPDQLIFLK